MSTVDDLTTNILAINPEGTIEAAELAAKLVEMGWDRKVPVIDATKIDSGTLVEVLRNGDWVRGRMVQVSPGGLLEVDTERGPWSGYAKGSRIRLPQ